MAQHGLRRGDGDGDGSNSPRVAAAANGNGAAGGLRVHIMCEIPSNALLAERFLRHCDGFSIGSNDSDLTQLTLGVDRDSGVQHGFDERDDAVKALMGLAIDAARAADKYIGICGQAPSDFPELTARLVRRGLRSLSLNADSVLSALEAVAAAEDAADAEEEAAAK
jgi:pyruvate,water dikinase